MLKVLILLPYYDRPNLVRNALWSIRNSSYPNWQLAYIDDGSKVPLGPIVSEILGDYPDKVKGYYSHDTVEQKIKQGGSRHGHFLNLAVKESDADIGIMLCDDDALVQDYMQKLSAYFTEHPDVPHTYSYIYIFDPTKEKPGPHLHTQDRTVHPCNTNPPERIAAMQIAWRIRGQKEHNIWFVPIIEHGLDAHFNIGLRKAFGPIPFSGFFSQYRGVYSDTLSERMNTPERFYDIQIP